jgi:hypothetical protein
MRVVATHMIKFASFLALIACSISHLQEVGAEPDLFHKVDNHPYSVTFLTKTPVFEWYVV